MQCFLSYRALLFILKTPGASEDLARVAMDTLLFHNFQGIRFPIHNKVQPINASLDAINGINFNCIFSTMNRQGLMIQHDTEDVTGKEVGLRILSVMFENKAAPMTDRVGKDP